MTGSETLDIQSAAASLINQLAIVHRTARIHSTNNIAFSNAADKLMDFVKDLLKTEHKIDLQLRGDFFYLEDQRVRYSPGHLLNFDYLAGEFKKIELGTVIFNEEISLQDIRIIIQTFLEASVGHGSFDDVAEKLSGLSHIELRRLAKIDIEKKTDAGRMVRKTYFSAVFYVKGVFNKIKNGEAGDIRKAKRVIASVVDMIIEHEQTLLGMTAIKNYDEYTYYHSANVSILSVAIGQRLGLERKLLIELGIASLFHDLGKVEVPYEILNKTTSLVDSEWRTIQKHPIWGVKALLKMRDIDELTIRSALVAFEHHMNLDHSGYPRLKVPGEIDLFSKIVSIADRYDAMTSVRIYSKTPMPPDKALSYMMGRAGEALDPLILKHFINMVGIYPIGTLIMLDSNELGLVFENNQLSLFRPRVMLITDPRGNWIEGKVVDLNEKNAKEEYRRKIVKTLDPKKYGINIEDYLL